MNATTVHDENKDPVSELKQQLKESVDRHVTLQRNVQSQFHVIVLDMNIGNVSLVDDVVTQLINLKNSQAGTIRTLIGVCIHDTFLMLHCVLLE